MNDCHVIVDRSRSSVSNGNKLLAGVDGRTAAARRFRDVIEDLTADLGGPELLSEAERQLVRRAAALSVDCEAAEAVMAQGGNLDMATYSTACNTLRRLLTTLGLERRQRDVTPDPLEYVQAAQLSDINARGTG